jgi:hypothetical protein
MSCAHAMPPLAASVNATTSIHRKTSISAS